MKIAISCDEYCAKVGEKYYLRDFGVTLLNRYLMVFDKVRFIVRTFNCKSLEDCGKYQILIQDPRIEIYPIPFFQGPQQFLKQYFRVSQSIKHALVGCDLGIYRLPSALGFSVWRESLRKHIPYAVELVYDCHDGYKQATGLSKFLWWRMHKKQLKACRNSIGMAPVTSEYLQSHYAPIDRELLMSHYSSVEMSDDFFFQAREYPEKESFRLVHVANQVQFKGRKGHEDVITSVKNLAEIGIKANVVFVGENYNNGIEQLKEYAAAIGVADRISFTGFLNSQQLRRVLIDSDIAILPTRAEGLPRVIIESMAVGLPCITTNVSGNPELIEPDYLFDYGDVETITKQLATLITNKQKYESASAVNFEKSKEFSKSVLDNRRRIFYQSLRNVIEKTEINP